MAHRAAAASAQHFDNCELFQHICNILHAAYFLVT